MTHSESGIMVIAATDRELAAPAGWLAIRCGVGPVEAGVATAAALAEHRPRAVLHVGIAGARRAATLAPASLVIGGESVYCDLAPENGWAPRCVSASPILLTALRDALPDAPIVTIGTSARVGGSADCPVEAMEGFAVLRAAAQAGIPAIEVRSISNEIEEPDRARWQLESAFAAITDVQARLVAELARCGR